MLAFLSSFKVPDLSLNLTHPSWDLFVIIFFVVAVFIYGLSLGRDRNILILFAIYIALALAASIPRFRLPTIGTVEFGKLLDFKVVVFLALFALLFVLLSRSSVLKGLAHVGAGSLFQVLLYSFLQVGLLLSITLSVLPDEARANFAPITQEIFTSDLGRFIWLVLPIISMALLSPEKKRSVPS